MISLYASYNPAKKMVEIDAGSPTSRNAIQESPELQERISTALVKAWKEFGNLPFVPARTTDKGVSLVPAKGTYNLTMFVHWLQRELGPEFTVGERPSA
jgi:hypothetical protein